MTNFVLTPKTHPELFEVGVIGEEFDPVAACDELIAICREREEDAIIKKLEDIYEEFFGEEDRFLHGDY
jgi:hypothetical protein